MNRYLNKLLTPILAVLISISFVAEAIGGGAITWSGANDGAYSNMANWDTTDWDSVGSEMSEAWKDTIYSAASAGKKVTYDFMDEKVWSCWVRTGSTDNPVVFAANESCGFNASWSFSCADQDNSQSAITIKSGTYTANALSYWGWGVGTKLDVNIEGGKVVFAGQAGGDDTNLKEDAIRLIFGEGGNSKIDVNISGGEMAVTGGNLDVGLWYADDTSTTTFDISGNGTLTCGSQASHSIIMGRWGSNVYIKLNDGGIVRAYNIIGGTGSSTREVTFNGGTLQALGVGDTALIGSGITVKIDSNGGTIDVGENNVTIAATVTGVGAIFIKGSGSVDFSSADLSGFTGVIVSEENGGAVTLPEGNDGSCYANSDKTLNCTGLIDFKSGVYAFNNMVVSGTSGDLTASGATIKIATTGSMNDPQIGDGTGGFLTVKDGTVYLGIATSAKWTKVNGGTINLDGGELQVGSIRYNGGSPVVNFNGGTLYQYGNTHNGNEIIENNDNWTLNVLAGGAKIYVPETPASNVSGNTTTISQVMQSGVEAGDTDGGLTKLGPGTLILAVAPTFNGGITLHEGSIVIPNTYPEENVTTDVSGYQVSVTAGEGVKTFTCSKIPVTWQGDEDSNWNTPGNWDGGTVPTASDNVVIPANSTITLDAAAYAATITADETVTIAASGYDAYYTYASGIKVALQNSEKWGGKFKISNINNTNSAEYNLGEFGNINSTIVLNSVTWYRMKCANPSNTNQKKNMGTLILEGTVKCTGTYGTSSTGGARDNYSIWFANIGGRGSLETSGSYSEGQGYRQKIALGNGFGFSGSLTTKYDCVIFGKGDVAQGNIKVESNYSAGLGLGAIWNPSSAIDIAGTLKVQQGADATATIATLKAPTVTFENGATIEYAKLGTIALINASDEGIAPSGSGTVNIAFGDVVTLADGVQLMSWAADATPDNVTFAFSDTSLNTDWVLTASETGLVLNTKNPVASVDGTNYSSLAEALAHASDDSSIVLKVNSAEAITLKGTQTLTIDSGIVYTGALTISSPTESETVAPTLVLNAETTVASVTVGEGATFALPRNYALLTGENALAIGGAGWVKFIGNNSSVYSAVAISVPKGTLEFAAGSTFKDIAAGTVYVNGTVTGTTLDAEGNIGNGSTLFTLTDGTFVNATVTAWVNGADTSIHCTNDSGVYKAGKVFYWRGGENNYGAENWSDNADLTSVSAEFPRVLDTAIISAGTINAQDHIYANIHVTGSCRINNASTQARDGSTYTYSGEGDISLGTQGTVLLIDKNKTLSLATTRNSRQVNISVQSKLYGEGKVYCSVENSRGTNSGARFKGDTSAFKGTVELYVPNQQNQDYCYFFHGIADVAAANNALSKWSVYSEGSCPHRVETTGNNATRDYSRSYTAFMIPNTDYYFGTLNACVGLAGSNSKAGYANNKIRLHLGEKIDEESWLGGSWYSVDYLDKVYWKAKTATFTHAITNTAEVALMGGGYVYVKKDTTEGGVPATFVPSVIKFLEFTDSDTDVRKGGYLTIDSDNAAIAGDIVNAIAAAGTGETQAAAGFNVTVDATATDVTTWTALATAGIIKKGAGTLTLAGTVTDGADIPVEVAEGAGALYLPQGTSVTCAEGTKKVGSEAGYDKYIHTTASGFMFMAF